MEKAIVTLTFDDGRRDNFKIVQDILMKYKLPATFYITTAFIENKINIGKSQPLTKADLDFIQKNNLFEISAHGDFHKNDIKDIRNGIIKLRNWYKDIEEMGFASPHSKMSKKQVINNKEFWAEMNIKYIRLGNNFRSFYWPEKCIAKLAKITKSKLLYTLIYQSSLMKDNKRNLLFSAPIMKEHSFKQIKSLIDSTVKQKKWVVFGLHSIGKENECPEHDTIWCWDTNKFDQLCRYLNKLREEGKLEVIKTIDIVRRR